MVEIKTYICDKLSLKTGNLQSFMTRNSHSAKFPLLIALLGFSTFPCAAQEPSASWSTPAIESQESHNPLSPLIQTITDEPLADRSDTEPYFQDWYEELEQALNSSKKEQAASSEEKDSLFDPVAEEQAPLLKQLQNGSRRQETLVSAFNEDDIESGNWKRGNQDTLPLYHTGRLRDRILAETDTDESETSKQPNLEFDFSLRSVPVDQDEQNQNNNTETPAAPARPQSLIPPQFAPARPETETQPAQTPQADLPAGQQTQTAPASIETPTQTQTLSPSGQPQGSITPQQTPAAPAQGQAPNLPAQGQTPAPSVQGQAPNASPQGEGDSPLYTPGQIKFDEPEQEPPPPVPRDKLIRVNFPNINVVELIRYIARETGKNFMFNEQDLLFNVTIISEEDTTIENLMIALMQELQVFGFKMIEQGNNIIIFPKDATEMGAISKVVDAENQSEQPEDSEIVTRVFRLNTLDGESASAILKPLTSEKAVIGVIADTNHIVVTDLTANVTKMAQLLKNLDSPKSGIVIGQYVVRSDFIDVLIDNAQRIMEPIAQEQTLTFVPHFASNSVFIVSTPYLVEKSLQVLRYLDQNQGTTSVLETSPEIVPESTERRPGWKLDAGGNWIFRPPTDTQGTAPPDGEWLVDPDGNWFFSPFGKSAEQVESETPLQKAERELKEQQRQQARGLSRPQEGLLPEGTWEKDASDTWVYQLRPGQTIAARKISRPPGTSAEALPYGHIERTRFSIFKLKYRKGDQVSDALRNVGESLSGNDIGNRELIAAIESVQWIESSNSLIFTGTPIALQKVYEFIQEIDVPLRQVFIEVLLLEMTLNDSLQYGVNWGTQFGGGNTALGESFTANDSQIPNILSTGAVTDGEAGTPSITGLANSSGYRLGIIGQHLTRCGIEFNNIAALIKATHQDEDTRILLNPKIFTEDNNPAELFVGLEVQYPTQSIASGDITNTITQNFETKEIGTKLTVTPQIGNNDVITLDIFEEHSNIAGQGTQQQTQSISTAGKTTTKSSTKTRVHVPNGFFVVLSGQMQEDEVRQRTNVPCLGGAPLIGGMFSEKTVLETKRNLLIFIRPTIVDTEEQIDDLTYRQQCIYRDKSYSRKDWEFEVDEALDLLNLKETGPNGDQMRRCFRD